MTEVSKRHQAEKPIEELELNKETLRDLTEEQADRVHGGGGGDPRADRVQDCTRLDTTC